MKYLSLLLLIAGTTPIQRTLPVGALIQYKVTTSDQSHIRSIIYYDSGQSGIKITDVPSGWTLSFQTTRVNQIERLECHTDLPKTGTITATIYVNGIPVKQAMGEAVSLHYAYPY